MFPVVNVILGLITVFDTKNTDWQDLQRQSTFCLSFSVEMKSRSTATPAHNGQVRSQTQLTVRSSWLFRTTAAYELFS